MTRPIDPAHDLADLLATVTPAEVAGAADRLRLIADLPDVVSSDRRARGRLVIWADVLDAAATAMSPDSTVKTGCQPP